MLGKLRDILIQVYTESEDDFSGIGIIIYKDCSVIPITHLRDTSPLFNNKSLVDSLVEISSINSEYHDGFHLISKDWKLTHVSQYFSPPIVPNLEIKRFRRIGGRYVAALYGSTIAGVEMCGIVSKDFGLALFKNGQEVHFEVIN